MADIAQNDSMENKTLEKYFFSFLTFCAADSYDFDILNIHGGGVDGFSLSNIFFTYRDVVNMCSPICSGVAV